MYRDLTIKWDYAHHVKRFQQDEAVHQVLTGNIVIIAKKLSESVQIEHNFLDNVVVGAKQLHLSKTAKHKTVLPGVPQIEEGKSANNTGCFFRR